MRQYFQQESQQNASVSRRKKKISKRKQRILKKMQKRKIYPNCRWGKGKLKRKRKLQQQKKQMKQEKKVHEQLLSYVTSDNVSSDCFFNNTCFYSDNIIQIQDTGQTKSVMSRKLQNLWGLKVEQLQSDRPRFKFGVGALDSIGTVRVPVRGSTTVKNGSQLTVHVVDSTTLPFLVSVSDLKNLRISLDFFNNVYRVSTGPWCKINYQMTGHPILNFSNLEKDIISDSVANCDIDSVSQSDSDSSMFHMSELSETSDECLLTLFSSEINSEKDQRDLITKLHRQLAHPSVEKFYKLISNSPKFLGIFRNYNVRKLIEENSEKCQQCKQVGRNAQRSKQSATLSTNFNSIIGMDTITIENRNYLTICDFYSRYTIMIPLKTKSAKEISSAFMRHWVQIFSQPQIMYCDAGTEYLAEFSEFVSYLGTHIRQQGQGAQFQNGLVERRIQQIKNTVQKLRKDTSLSTISLDDQVFWQVQQLNNLCFSHTKFTPSMLQFGNAAQTLTDDFDEDGPQLTLEKCLSLGMQKQLKIKKQAAASAVSVTADRKLTNQQKHNIRKNTFEQEIRQGDEVYYRSGTTKNDHWQPGQVVGFNSKQFLIKPQQQNRIVTIQPNMVKLNYKVVIEDTLFSDVDKLFNYNQNKDTYQFVTVQSNTERNDKNILRSQIKPEEWPLFHDSDVQEFSSCLKLCMHKVPITSLSEKEIGEIISTRVVRRIKPADLVGGQKLGMKQKSRLVQRGFLEKQERNEINQSPTVSRIGIRTLFSFLQSDVNLYKNIMIFDVGTQFLRSDELEKTIHISAPQDKEFRQQISKVYGDESFNPKEHVFKLRKPIYGLKCQPICWYRKFSKEIKQQGFVNTRSPCIFILKSKCGKHVDQVLQCHVDDAICSYRNQRGRLQISKIMNSLNVQQKSVESGRNFKYLGFDVFLKNNHVKISANNYLKELDVEEYEKLYSNLSGNLQTSLKGIEISHYRSLLGQLAWTTNCSPKNSYDISKAAQSLSDPTKGDFKRLIKMAKTAKNNDTTLNIPKLSYKSKELYLITFSDQQISHDYPESDQKGENGEKLYYVPKNYSDAPQSQQIFALGNIISDYQSDSEDAPSKLFDLNIIGWFSRKHRRVQRSSLSQETYSQSDQLDEQLEQKQLIEDLMPDAFNGWIHYTDCKSLVDSVHQEMPMQSEKRVLTEIRLIKELVKENRINFEHCLTDSNLQDPLTKHNTKVTIPLIPKNVKVILG